MQAILPATVPGYRANHRDCHRLSGKLVPCDDDGDWNGQVSDVESVVSGENKIKIRRLVLAFQISLMDIASIAPFPINKLIR